MKIKTEIVSINLIEMYGIKSTKAPKSCLYIWIIKAELNYLEVCLLDFLKYLLYGLRYIYMYWEVNWKNENIHMGFKEGIDPLGSYCTVASY